MVVIAVSAFCSHTFESFGDREESFANTEGGGEDEEKGGRERAELMVEMRVVRRVAWGGGRRERIVGRIEVGDGEDGEDGDGEVGEDGDGEVEEEDGEER